MLKEGKGLENEAIEEKQMIYDGKKYLLRLFNGNLFEVIDEETGEIMKLILPKVDFQIDEQKVEGGQGSRFDMTNGIVGKLLEDGARPAFSVPRIYLDEILKNGLKPRPTWTKHLLLAGTLGVEFYNPKGDRVICIPKPGVDLKKLKLKARLTGKDMIFQGVVVTETPMAREDLLILDGETFLPIEDNNLEGVETGKIIQMSRKRLKNISL